MFKAIRCAGQRDMVSPAMGSSSSPDNLGACFQGALMRLMCPSRTISLRSSSSVSPVVYMILARFAIGVTSWIVITYHRLSSGQKSSACRPLSSFDMSACVRSRPGACGESAAACSPSIMLGMLASPLLTPPVAVSPASSCCPDICCEPCRLADLVCIAALSSSGSRRRFSLLVFFSACFLFSWAAEGRLAIAGADASSGDSSPPPSAFISRGSSSSACSSLRLPASDARCLSVSS
mmetsp:Transcript_5769/g.14018  ORF Transcript_5769/g.14018 Transcript_5769/m.14018 type:complete len:236 (-) Transcript_5769:545-1252(-)